jgi:anthrone oxygenase-like protein
MTARCLLNGNRPISAGIQCRPLWQVVGFLLGVLSWWLTGRLAFIVGAALMLANWPWTMFVIMPTNKTLMATELSDAGAHTRALLVKWNSLHAVRTALGGLAVVSFLVALSSN